MLVRSKVTAKTRGSYVTEITYMRWVRVVNVRKPART